MAVFTPRALQVPNMRTDYSAENSAFSGLGQTLGNLPGDFRKEQLNAQKQQLLGQLANGKADYNKVGLGLVALGDTQGGASLLALGQKQQQLDAQKGIAGIFSGGGSTSSPSTVGVAPAPISPSASNVPVAGGSAASAPYAADAQSNGLYVTSAYRGPDHPLTKANPNSAHAQGTAWDLRARTPEDADAVMTKQRGLLSARGLVEGRDYKFIDEVRNPSAHATGPHVHVQLTPEGAARNGSGGVQVAENEADVQRLEQGQAARASQPAQVAGTADLPPQGANATPTQAQGFAVPGNMLPPNDPFPRVTTQQLYGVLQNPQASDGQRAMAKSIIDNRMKYSDENAPDKREMTRLQTEKLRREVEGEGATPLTAQERKDFGIPEGQAAYKTRSGEIKFGPAGTKVDINQKGESKFEEALGTAQAKRWNGYIEEGDVAQGRLADIQTLRETSRRLGSQGSSANLKATIGPYAESLGIKVDGLSDIQLYESITQRLAPTLRQPGSGSQSDTELKGFLRAIGPLSNHPAAREMILDTYEAASRNDLARSQIASRLASGEINRGQAERELRSLPNPMEAYREFRKANPDLVGQALKESARVDHEQRNAPPRVDSADAYSKLKPGDKYTDPDGNVRTKR